MAGYLLDTTTIIKHLLGDEEVTSCLYEFGVKGDIVGCCCINIAETYAGMREKEKEKTDKFIDSLYYFEVTRDIAKLAGRLKQKCAKEGNTLSIPDAVIAAIAMKYGLTLVTENVKHYPFPELEVKKV